MYKFNGFSVTFIATLNSFCKYSTQPFILEQPPVKYIPFLKTFPVIEGGVLSSITLIASATALNKGNKDESYIFTIYNSIPRHSSIYISSKYRKIICNITSYE